ncbi:MAG: type IV secretion system protein [Rickettsiales bacterium]|nr:type IV secretion system protein [Rickettsiales bacterium]
MKKLDKFLLSIVLMLFLTSCDRPPFGSSCYDNLAFGQILSSTTDVHAQNPDVLAHCQTNPDGPNPGLPDQGCKGRGNDYAASPPVLAYNECISECLTVRTPNASIWTSSGVEVLQNQPIKLNIAGGVNTCNAKPPFLFFADPQAAVRNQQFYEWGHNYTDFNPSSASLTTVIRTQQEVLNATSTTSRIFKYIPGGSGWYTFSGFSLDNGEQLIIDAFRETAGACQTFTHDPQNSSWRDSGVTIPDGASARVTITGSVGLNGGAPNQVAGYPVRWSWDNSNVPQSNEFNASRGEDISTTSSPDTYRFIVNNTSGSDNTLRIRYQDSPAANTPTPGAYADNTGIYEFQVCSTAVPQGGNMEFQVGSTGVADMEIVPSETTNIVSSRIEGTVQGEARVGDNAGYRHQIANVSAGDAIRVRFLTATDWTLRFRTSGCPQFNGKQLQMRISPSGPPISLDPALGNNTDLIANRYGVIFFRVIDTESPADWSNNSGQYDVSVSVVRGATQVASNLSDFIIEPIRTLFYGPLNIPGDHTSGRDPSGSGAVVVKIYSGITQDGGFLSLASTTLVLYLVIYGIVIALGVGEGAYTRYDLVVRSLKIGFILIIINPGSWVFMTQHLFDIFIDGVLDILTFFGSPLVEYTPELVADPNNPPPLTLLNASDDFFNNTPFGFMDRTIGFFLEGPTWIKIFALILDPPLGPIYAFFIIAALFQIIVLFIKALLLFLVSIVAIALLLMVSPFFFLTILFTQTKSMFDSWMRALVSFLLQPVLLIVTLALMNEFIIAILSSVLSFEACWGCKLTLGFPFTDITIPPDISLNPFAFCIMYFWDPVGAPTQFGHAPVAFAEILVLLIFLDLAKKFMRWSIQMADAITQAFGTSLAGATQGVWSTLGLDRIENRATSLPQAGAKRITRAGIGAAKGTAVFAAKTAGSGLKAGVGAALGRSSNPFLSRHGTAMAGNARHGLSKRGRQISTSGPVSVVGTVGRGIWGAGQGLAAAGSAVKDAGKFGYAAIRKNEGMKQKAKDDLTAKGHQLKEGIRKQGTKVKKTVNRRSVAEAARKLYHWKEAEVEKAKVTGATPRRDALFGKKSNTGKKNFLDATYRDHERNF